MMDLQRGLFVATICAFAGASARASTPPPPWPEGFSLVTIEGSRTYKILKSGVISGKGGKRLGMGILYATTSTDLATLKTAAADLFTYMIPRAEQEHDDAVAVLAQPGWDRNAQSVTFGIIYKLHPDGWHVYPGDERKPFPSVERQIDAEATPDRDAEAKARSSVETWLPLLDADDFERGWAGVASIMKTRPKTKWTESLQRIRRFTGKLVSRRLFSISAMADVPNAPHGKYVMVQFRSRFAQRQTAMEEVIAVLCEDGQWRVAGYDVFSGASLEASVVLEPHPTP